MKKFPFAVAVMAVLLISLSLFAQATTPAVEANQFSVSAKVLSVPGLSQTAIASDLGASFKISNRLGVREDSILVPADSTSAYLGSVQYSLPFESILKHTTLPKNEFAAYAVAGLGVDRLTNTQHIAGQVGIGVNYDPSKSKHYSVNLFEIRWARLPGINQNAVLFSSGVGYSF